MLHRIENYTLNDCIGALRSPWVDEAIKDQIKVQYRRLRALEKHWSQSRSIVFK